MQVRKRDTSRIYALKTIRKAHIVSRSEVTHTLAERTVLAQVNNPFIVPLKFSFQSPEKLYLVLAFVNGGELFHHLQREGRFSVERARFYAAELLCALECLHSLDVIYRFTPVKSLHTHTPRDLKPENIMLDFTGHIALCDFGLCKLNMTESEKTNSTPLPPVPSALSQRSFLWDARVPCARAAARERIHQDGRLVDLGCSTLRNALWPTSLLRRKCEHNVSQDSLRSAAISR